MNASVRRALEGRRASLGLGLMVAVACACAETEDVAAPTATADASTSSSTPPKDTADSKKFVAFYEDLSPCIGAVVQGIDASPESDAIRIEITRRADLAECGCVFPKQTWLPAEFIDANGELIYGVDVNVPQEVDQPSVQRIDLYHSKFDGYEVPYRIEIRCETELPPG